MRNNNVSGAGKLSGGQFMPIEDPIADPEAMPVVPPELDFQQGHALAAVRQALLQAPALRDWCNLAFNGQHDELVCDLLINLMLHKHADDRHLAGMATASAVALRELMLAQLAPLLSHQGRTALQDSLDAHAVANAFALHLAQRDRWYLNGLVCRQEAADCLARGEYKQAATHFENAANSFANVPETAVLVAECFRQAAQAHAQDHHPITAAALFVKVGLLEFAHVNVLNDRAPPQFEDVMACLDAFARGARDLVEASALYRKMGLHTESIALNRKAADAYATLKLYAHAARCHDEIADTWAGIVDTALQAGDLTRVTAAASASVQAAKNAAHYYLKVDDYVSAGHAMVKAGDYVAAGHALALGGAYEDAAGAFAAGQEYGLAGGCYQWVAQCHEIIVTQHQQAGRTTQARDATQEALTYYLRAIDQFTRAAQHPVDGAQIASATATAETRVAALRLALQAPQALASE
ncbi:soluble NSF attachment family protein [Pandoraea sputorum]|uniref:Uncharacterized protein n=1 Tax=Pandoraea sputorum TaxID=93222 RepID=A0A5E5BMN0_9BURK|nr:hypothetical protein [Pandoraea sputorum]VVE85763.1 hypothetical protein PSP31121_05404 [Pandoraea sputorum]